MKYAHQDRRGTPWTTLLLTTLLAIAPAWADDDKPAAAAQAAKLETQADELEARTTKECLNVAAASRPLCREQLGRAVARLRNRAQRLR
jgi:hypothetical protein